jgi:antirestriction protein ArdC
MSERADKIAALRAQLERETAALQDEAGFKTLPRQLGKFHKYSWNNALLIWAQKPEATYLKGFKGWLDLGRCVRKGERGVMIFSPKPWKRTGPDGDEASGMALGAAYVFDYAQTDPLPNHPQPFQPPATPDVTGDPALAEAAYAALAGWLAGRGVVVQTVDDDDRDAEGWHKPATHEIYVRPASPARMLAVLVHEAAHALQPCDAGWTYAQWEVLAQSVSYVVCAALGIDAGAFSAHYVALWLRDDAASFKRGMAFVQQTADELLGAVEPALAESHFAVLSQNT